MPPLGDIVRRRDPDRYFCALFAPADRREALFTLYAFNDELARALEVASEPGLALIRLQWWHEVVEGADRRHEVAAPLRALLASGVLPAAPLLDMISAREADAEGTAATLPAFLARMRAGPGSLAMAAGLLLGADAAEQARLRDLGAAYGIAGTLRNAAAMAAPCVLPADMLQPAGLQLLGRPKRMMRNSLAAALPGVLARRDLRKAPSIPRGVGDKLAVLVAALRGEV